MTESLDVSWDLSGKTALVCGASQGIGAACARIFAASGARVLLLARSHDRLLEVKAQLKQASFHETLAVDLSNHKEVKALVKEKIESTGAIHILVNNSAGPPSGQMVDATHDQMLAAFNQHVLANRLLTSLVVEGMKESNYGRIINILSTSVKAPIANLGVSNTIRGAVANWAKTLATELGPFGVTVNNVLPGFTETPRLSSLIEEASQRQKVSCEKLAATWKQSIPARRFAQPHETAYAVCFLASAQASYINGINLPVDGGRTLSL